ncbi:MAG: hypothetical protein SFV21_08795 [Rhodospirillaceae bacterium]|nr:hypothetical protein [Rhodospirillaceae bacterium]
MVGVIAQDGWTDDLKAAVRRFQAGLYAQAGVQLLEILKRAPDDADARYFFRLVERRLRPVQPAAKPTLIWQFPPDAAWETDWLRGLLGPLCGAETVDNTWSAVADPMIVVDNRLVPEKAPYYRQAFERGARIILIHLSDEAFKDDLGAYRYCDAVIRNYRSELLAELSGVFFLPLGPKSGFAATGDGAKPASARRHAWAFAGDARKLTRGPMLEEMAKAAPGFTHLTSDFGSADALPTAEYRALLDDTVFAPCPAGWSNLESFRVYEALEAGCIPIVERRANFDYFTQLLGPHPMPTVVDWRDGADLMRGLLGTGELEPLRRRCADWWRAYTPQLTREVGEFVARALGQAPSRHPRA